MVAGVAHILMGGPNKTENVAEVAATEADKNQPFNYTNSRKIDRPQTQVSGLWRLDIYTICIVFNTAWHQGVVYF